ncbi:MAG: AAA family ATPase, partial [Deltaproteobacteria bacterium]|nr:AAA family ATPase [Deltaproteobacteria bacterium]
MVEKLKGLASGVQTFEQIIEQGSVYVDKTPFLAKMISSDNKVWFLTRPRRFGKSLTVSTLEDLFSGRKELFKGLYIASQLKKARFAPRPVIRLDMTLPTLSESVKVFKKSLGLETTILAKKLGVKVDPTLQPGEMLRILIMEAAEKAKRPCAILIDEYDAPFVAFMERPP